MFIVICPKVLSMTEVIQSEAGRSNVLSGPVLFLLRAEGLAVFGLATVILLGAGYYLAPQLMPFVLIWAAHIGMGRACSYGSKFSEFFKSNHSIQMNG